MLVVRSQFAGKHCFFAWMTNEPEIKSRCCKNYSMVMRIVWLGDSRRSANWPSELLATAKILLQTTPRHATLIEQEKPKDDLDKPMDALDELEI